MATVSQMMDLIDEVDYHCCISCDNIFPNEYELSVHVMEVHQGIVDTNSKLSKDESMDIQSMIIDDNDFIQCDDYLEVFNDRSSSFKVLYTSSYLLLHLSLNLKLPTNVL